MQSTSKTFFSTMLLTACFCTTPLTSFAMSTSDLDMSSPDINGPAGISSPEKDTPSGTMTEEQWMHFTLWYLKRPSEIEARAKNRNKDADCFFCYSEALLSLPCRHQFCEKCKDKWSMEQTSENTHKLRDTCPMCQMNLHSLRSKENACSLCCSEACSVLRSCRHKFCEKCTEAWLIKHDSDNTLHDTCPTCQTISNVVSLTKAAFAKMINPDDSIPVCNEFKKRFKKLFNDGDENNADNVSIDMIIHYDIEFLLCEAQEEKIQDISFDAYFDKTWGVNKFFKKFITDESPLSVCLSYVHAIFILKAFLDAKNQPLVLNKHTWRPLITTALCLALKYHYDHAIYSNEVWSVATKDTENLELLFLELLDWTFPMDRAIMADNVSEKPEFNDLFEELTKLLDANPEQNQAIQEITKVFSF